MAAPLVIAAPAALKLAGWTAAGAVALYAVARARGDRPRPAHEEQAFDDVAHGVSVDASRDTDRSRADLRAGWRGALRLGPGGPGVEVDASALARLRLRRVRAGE